MILAIFLLLASTILIYLSCTFFVNAIEWVGHKFNMTKNATGTILAAFGTALPESVVTFIAVVFGNTPEQKDIGIGAAIGGPLVLATIAYSVVGFTFIMSKKNQKKKILSKSTELRLRHDQLWFMKIFIVKITLGLIIFKFKPWLGIGFLIAYALYVKQEIKQSDDPEHLDFLEPLKIRSHDNNPSLIWAILQNVLALLVIFISAQ
ncbi:MAG: sodium:calcium antiporter, partial [Legionella longbeachae]|nr:sodium:calcium antiporter [Legionella longbeachae]